MFSLIKISLLALLVCISKGSSNRFLSLDAEMKPSNKSLHFILDTQQENEAYLTWINQTIFIWRKEKGNYSKSDTIFRTSPILDCKLVGRNLKTLFILDANSQITYGRLNGDMTYDHSSEQRFPYVSVPSLRHLIVS